MKSLFVGVVCMIGAASTLYAQNISIYVRFSASDCTVCMIPVSDLDAAELWYLKKKLVIKKRDEDLFREDYGTKIRNSEIIVSDSLHQALDTRINTTFHVVDELSHQVLYSDLVKNIGTFAHNIRAMQLLNRGILRDSIQMRLYTCDIANHNVYLHRRKHLYLYAYDAKADYPEKIQMSDSLIKGFYVLHDSLNGLRDYKRCADDPILRDYAPSRITITHAKGDTLYIMLLTRKPRIEVRGDSTEEIIGKKLHCTQICA